MRIPIIFFSVEAYKVQDERKKVRTVATISIISFLAIVIFAILLATGIFRKNPYGQEIKIYNFAKYYPNTPQDVQDAISAMLYNTSIRNLTDGETRIPHKELNAYIKEGDITSTTDKDQLLHYGQFAVNVPYIKQTFLVQFQWSDDTEVANTIGDRVIIQCLRGEKSSYNSEKCFDDFTSNEIQLLYDENPILNQLPINTSYYTEDSEYISYRIDYKTNEDATDFAFVITDHTGGNRERAISELAQDYNIDVSNYKFDYIDESASYALPARAPND